MNPWLIGGIVVGALLVFRGKKQQKTKAKAPMKGPGPLVPPTGADPSKVPVTDQHLPPVPDPMSSPTFEQLTPDSTVPMSDEDLGPVPDPMAPVTEPKASTAKEEQVPKEVVQDQLNVIGQMMSDLLGLGQNQRFVVKMAPGGAVTVIDKVSQRTVVKGSSPPRTIAYLSSLQLAEDVIKQAGEAGWQGEPIIVK